MDQVLQVALGGLTQGSVFALVAIGFALVYRVTGAVNLAQGAFVVLGALTTYSIETSFGWSPLLAVPSAVVIVGIVGAGVARFAFAPALGRLTGSGMVILSAGLLALTEGAMLVIWGSQPYQLAPFSGYRPVQLLGIPVPSQTLWNFAVTTAIVVALWYVLQRTRLGRALRACSENPAAATLMGIDVKRMAIASFAVAAALGALSGAVVGPLVSLQYDAGRAFTISGFVAVAIGGFGSFVGALVGGLGLGTIEQFAAGYVSSLFSTSVALVLLLFVLVARPTGLFGRGSERRQDVRDVAVHAAHMAPRVSARTMRALGGAALALVLALPILVREPGLMSSFVITLLLFVAVLGLDVLMGYAGQVSLGHAAFVAIGGYSAGISTARFHQAPLTGMLLGLAISLACAAVLSSITVRLRGLYMALATLAFGLLVDSLAIAFPNFTGGPSGLTGIPHFALGPFVFETPTQNYYLAAGVAIASVVLLSLLMRSDFGRALRAVRADPTAALSLGIDVRAHKLYAFLIGAAFASVAGSLYAFYFQFLSPDAVGTSRSLEFVSMLVVGGETSLVGPVFGVALLTLMPTVFQPLANFKELVTGGVLVAALMYMPSGLYGAFLHAIHALERIGPVRSDVAGEAKPWA